MKNVAACIQKDHDCFQRFTPEIVQTMKLGGGRTYGSDMRTSERGCAYLQSCFIVGSEITQLHD